MGSKANITEEQREKIKALLASGVSQRKTAEQVGVSATTVNKIAKEKKDDVEQMRTLKRDEWVNEAWKTINMYVKHVQKEDVIKKTSARDSAILIGTLHDKMIKNEELAMRREELELKHRELEEKAKGPDKPNVSVYVNALKGETDVWDDDE